MECTDYAVFRVVEVWIEGTRLAELLTPEMQAEYVETVRLDRWEAMLAEMPAACSSQPIPKAA